jgi:alkylation response protein AidB-like acyl-CoA dehydrogenase
LDLTLDDEERAFRDELRAWLARHAPTDEPADEDSHVRWRLGFHRKLAAAGWAAVHWPVEYGGRGATLMQSAIFHEELARAHAPLPSNPLGIRLAGPTIMEWGTEDQKDRYLAPMLQADEIWCQGFSEPEAGSDLAALKTRAVRVDDGWSITGQKVWTSEAQHAKRCMLLARTDLDAPKHRGLTYFILDMEQEGVRVSPLRQMTGESEFNEVFLDGARVSNDDVVGPVGNGWKVALTTLMNERSGLGFVALVRIRQVFDRLLATAHDLGRLEDAAVAERFGELHARLEALRLTSFRSLTTIERYGQPGPEGSLAKWLAADINQQLTQFAADVIGPTALCVGNRWAYEIVRARGSSIEGGTTEVQKNIIAERVLGLPKSR